MFQVREKVRGISNMAAADCRKQQDSIDGVKEIVLNMRRQELGRQISKLNMDAAVCESQGNINGKCRRSDLIRQVSHLSMGSAGFGDTTKTIKRERTVTECTDESSVASDPTAEYGKGVDVEKFQKSLEDIDFQMDSLKNHRSMAAFDCTAKADDNDANSISFFSIDLDRLLSLGRK